MKRSPTVPQRRWHRSLDLAPVLLVLAVVLASGALASLARSVPVLQQSAQAASGVQLVGSPVAGMDAAALRTQVVEMARSLPSMPQDAQLTPGEAGVIPSLDGVVVDVEATVRAVLNARQGADVPLRAATTEAEITVLDLPPEPIRQGNPSKAQVSLAINVAWGNEYIPAVLDILARHKVRATFFLVGSWAEQFPDLAQKIAAAGHEIASHGYTTVEYQGLTEDQLRRQVEESEEAIIEATGQRPALFSPHKGDWTPELLALLRQKEYLPIHWTVDTVDWKNPSPDEMNSRVLRKVTPGSIILMHPTLPVAEGLDGLLSGLEAKGLKVVTIGTLLDPNPLTRDVQPGAGGALPADAVWL